MRSVEKKFPILVPDYRFDQKNEMFKRRIWDKDFIEPGKRLYSEVKYQNRYGYRSVTVDLCLHPKKIFGRFESDPDSVSLFLFYLFNQPNPA